MRYQEIGIDEIALGVSNVTGWIGYGVGFIGPTAYGLIAPVILSYDNRSIGSKLLTTSVLTAANYGLTKVGISMPEIMGSAGDIIGGILGGGIGLIKGTIDLTASQIGKGISSLERMLHTPSRRRRDNTPR